MKNGGIFYGRLAFLCLFGIVYGHLEYFGIFFSILACSTKKNLATQQTHVACRMIPVENKKQKNVCICINSVTTLKA
jgi:hypothetical protein